MKTRIKHVGTLVSMIRGTLWAREPRMMVLYGCLTLLARYHLVHHLNTSHVNFHTFQHKVFGYLCVLQLMRVLHLRTSYRKTEWSKALVPTLLLRLMIPVAIPLIYNGVIVHHLLVAFKYLNLHTTHVRGHLQL